MNTLTRLNRFTVPAAPARVFPLLCPTREYDWIPTWRCELLHSVSGIAELDCVFRTQLPGQPPMLWVVSRYEPPARIEFTCFVTDLFVMRLAIALTPEGDATRLDWTRRWLAVSPAGDAWIASWSEADYEKMMDFLRRTLTHYLVTGTMLRP